MKGETGMILTVGNIGRNFICNRLIIILTIFISSCNQRESRLQAQESQQDLILQWKKAVVLLEMKNSVTEEYMPIGTGFLVADEKGVIPPLLVTARHMFFEDDEQKIFRGWIWVGVNSANPKKGRERFAIKLSDVVGKNIITFWKTAPRIDVAAIPIQLPKDADAIFIPLGAFENPETIKEGRHILVVGFPGGLTSEWKKVLPLEKETLAIITPIFRSGVIAWFPGSGTTYSDKFFVDASIFSGNSGSPVLLDPLIQTEPNVITGGRTPLLGIITETQVRKFGALLKPEAFYISLSANIGVAMTTDKIKEVVLLFAKKKP